MPFDPSSMTHWRQRLGEKQLAALIKESLSVAHKTGTLATKDLERAVVDTTSPRRSRIRLMRGW
jgi:IS5 family transposase